MKHCTCKPQIVPLERTPDVVVIRHGSQYLNHDGKVVYVPVRHGYNLACRAIDRHAQTCRSAK